MTRGLVTSLARPVSNATGLSVVAPKLISKRIEPLTRAVAGGSQIAVLWQPAALQEHTQQDRLKSPGRTLKVRVQFVAVRDPKDLDRAFRRDNPSGVRQY